MELVSLFLNKLIAANVLLGGLKLWNKKSIITLRFWHIKHVVPLLYEKVAKRIANILDKCFLLMVAFVCICRRKKWRIVCI